MLAFRYTIVFILPSANDLLFPFVITKCVSQQVSVVRLLVYRVLYCVCLSFIFSFYYCSGPCLKLKKID